MSPARIFGILRNSTVFLSPTLEAGFERNSAVSASPESTCWQLRHRPYQSVNSHHWVIDCAVKILEILLFAAHAHHRERRFIFFRPFIFLSNPWSWKVTIFSKRAPRPPAHWARNSGLSWQRFPSYGGWNFRKKNWKDRLDTAFMFKRGYNFLRT